MRFKELALMNLSFTASLSIFAYLLLWWLMGSPIGTYEWAYLFAWVYVVTFGIELCIDYFVNPES